MSLCSCQWVGTGCNGRQGCAFAGAPEPKKGWFWSTAQYFCLHLSPRVANAFSGYDYRRIFNIKRGDSLSVDFPGTAPPPRVRRRYRKPPLRGGARARRAGSALARARHSKQEGDHLCQRAALAASLHVEIPAVRVEFRPHEGGSCWRRVLCSVQMHSLLRFELQYGTWQQRQILEARPLDAPLA